MMGGVCLLMGRWRWRRGGSCEVMTCAESLEIVAASLVERRVRQPRFLVTPEVARA